VVLTSVFFTQCEKTAAPPPVIIETEPTVKALITTFLDGNGTYKDISFSEVVAASTGFQLIPLDTNNQVDSQILDEITKALDQSLKFFNQKQSPTHFETQVNQVATFFEEKIRETINAAPELNCDYARTIDGNLQRAGYPDLRIEHEPSGRVIYFDIKLVETGTLDSSLRTFYFTPKGSDGKVLNDGLHLLVGIEHNGVASAWKFLRWHLVDLARFKVRLKAEFHANNQDIYLPEAIIRRGDMFQK
jgi:hypothetical protein